MKARKNKLKFLKETNDNFKNVTKPIQVIKLSSYKNRLLINLMSLIRLRFEIFDSNDFII